MPENRKIRSHGVAASKGGALTLDDLAEFVADAREAGIPGDALPIAAIRLNGKVRGLTVDINSAKSAEAEQ